MAYEFVSSAAADEHTLRWNREAYDRIQLRPRVLRDVSNIDTTVTLLGRKLAFPILLAPTAYHRAIHPEGEIATARGAGAAGATWVVSTATTTPLEEIARAATAPLWMQLYVQPVSNASSRFFASSWRWRWRSWDGARCTKSTARPPVRKLNLAAVVSSEYPTF